MTDLSPAAQAVLKTAGIHHGLFNEEIVQRRRMVAAALRAAVAHTQVHHGNGVWECDADELLTIATERENQ